MVRTISPLLRKLPIRSVAWLFVCFGITSLAGSVATAQVGTIFGKNKVQYSDFNWKYIQSPHFDIYFYQGGEQLATFVAAHAETSLADIESTLRYDITNRIAILVYNSHNDFQQTNAVGEFLPEGVGGVTELLKNRVVIPFEGDYELFRHVIHHELTHAVINDMFIGGSYQALLTGGGMEIPSWMNEGLAEYTSLHGLDLETDMFMRDATLNDAVPRLDQLGGYVQYRVGQTMYWYISQRYGPEKVGELLHRIKTSRSVDEGFRSTFGLSVGEFGDKFLQAMKVLYYPDIAKYQDPEDFAQALADHTKLDNYINASPEVSPRGDKVAYISDHNGYYDVYVQSLVHPKEIDRVLSGGGASADFEELHILTPGLSWSPDETQLALASKAGATDAIFILNIATGDQQRLPNISLDAIQQMQWSPDGKYLAFVGVHGGRSDLYLYDLNADTIRALTNDLYSDHDPTWSPDSKSLYFTSEREDNLQPNQAADYSPDSLNYASKNLDIYRIAIQTSVITRITHTEGSNEFYPAVTNDNKLLYLSDANGINNIWTSDSDGSHARPLTNSLSKIDQISISSDGTKLAFSAMHKGGYDIYLLRNPLERHIDSLAPTEFRKRQSEHLASRLDSLSSSRPTAATVDTTQGYAGVGVDLHNYVFGKTPGFQRSTQHPESDVATAVVTDYRDSSGHYIVHPYRTRFTPDVILGTAGYTGYYGLAGTTQMLFSDELGNQQLFFATNLIIDFKNSDFVLAYYNLTHRMNWGLQGFHLAQFIQEQYDASAPGVSYPIARFMSSGLVGTFSYPFNRFSRVDVNATAAIFQKDVIVDLDIPTKTKYAFFPQISYVHDDVLWSYFYPVSGSRFNIGVSVAPPITSDWLGFVTPTIDFRHYFPLTSGISLASRITAAASFGPTPQKFFIGGVDSWINSFYKDIPTLNDPQDYAFFTPGMPLRGFAYDEKIGTRYVLGNLELRYPFPVVLGGFPLALFGDSFVDAGTAWNKSIYLFQRDPVTDNWITKDLLLSVGTGIRTYLFGFYVHLDLAWTTNMNDWSHPVYLWSIGEDF